MEAILKKEIIVNKIACRAIGAAAFIILTALGAFVRIPLPFTPVPLTLQTFFVLLCGAFLGSRLSVVSQAGYILLGACGVSLFTGTGSGLLYILGPTGGYLLGFVIAGIFTGKFINTANGSFLRLFCVFCLADLIILVSGATWLKFSLNLGFSQALFLGLVPFIAGDLLKIYAATFAYLKLGARAKEIF